MSKKQQFKEFQKLRYGWQITLAVAMYLSLSACGDGVIGKTNNTIGEACEDVVQGRASGLVDFAYRYCTPPTITHTVETDRESCSVYAEQFLPTVGICTEDNGDFVHRVEYHNTTSDHETVLLSLRVDWDALPAHAIPLNTVVSELRPFALLVFRDDDVCYNSVHPTSPGKFFAMGNQIDIDGKLWCPAQGTWEDFTYRARVRRGLRRGGHRSRRPGVQPAGDVPGLRPVSQCGECGKWLWEGGDLDHSCEEHLVAVLSRRDAPAEEEPGKIQ